MSGKVQIVLTKGDELLVLLGDCLKMDAKVTDNSGKVLGKLVRIMGPVAKPYGLIKLRSNSGLENDLYIKC